MGVAPAAGTAAVQAGPARRRVRRGERLAQLLQMHEPDRRHPRPQQRVRPREPCQPAASRSQPMRVRSSVTWMALTSVTPGRRGSSVNGTVDDTVTVNECVTPSPPGSVAVTSITAVPDARRRHRHASPRRACRRHARRRRRPVGQRVAVGVGERLRHVYVEPAPRRQPAVGQGAHGDRPPVGPGRIPPRGGHGARGVEDGHRVGRAGHARDAGAEGDAQRVAVVALARIREAVEMPAADAGIVAPCPSRTLSCATRGTARPPPRTPMGSGSRRPDARTRRPRLWCTWQRSCESPVLCPARGPKVRPPWSWEDMLKAWRMPASPPY